MHCSNMEEWKQRSCVEPETGVRRDMEVVSGLASESQIRERGPQAARADMYCWEHTTSVAGLVTRPG